MGEFAPRAEKPKMNKDEAAELTDADIAEAKTSDKGAEAKADLDNLLDEIDGVLEENAAEFVKGYVQKGGQ